MIGLLLVMEIGPVFIATPPRGRSYTTGGGRGWSMSGRPSPSPACCIRSTPRRSGNEDWSYFHHKKQTDHEMEEGQGRWQKGSREQTDVCHNSALSGAIHQARGERKMGKGMSRERYYPLRIRQCERG